MLKLPYFGRVVWVFGAAFLHRMLLGKGSGKIITCLRQSVLEHFFSKTLEIYILLHILGIFSHILVYRMKSVRVFSTFNINIE